MIDNTGILQGYRLIPVLCEVSRLRLKIRYSKAYLHQNHQDAGQRVQLSITEILSQPMP